VEYQEGCHILQKIEKYHIKKNKELGKKYYTKIKIIGKIKKEV